MSRAVSDLEGRPERRASNRRRVRVPAEWVRAISPTIGTFPPRIERPLLDLLGFVWGRPPRGTRISAGRVGGVTGTWTTPPTRLTPDLTLLYLHGGGYMSGSPQSHRGAIAALADSIGARAFAPHYRLAPDHPYPAALDDARAVYRALIDDGHDPERIVVAGESAGGGLTLALALALRDAGEPMPAALGLICPWLDLTVDLAEERPPAPREPLLRADRVIAMARSYIGSSADPADPRISPLRGELTGLPPIVLQSSGDDLIRDDSQRLAEILATIPGALHEHRHFDGLWHVFQLHVGVMTEADEAIAELGAALRSAAENRSN